jgi:amino acid adenylation domain-containing protein
MILTLTTTRSLDSPTLGRKNSFEEQSKPQCYVPTLLSSEQHSDDGVTVSNSITEQAVALPMSSSAEHKEDGESFLTSRFSNALTMMDIPCCTWETIGSETEKIESDSDNVGNVTVTEPEPADRVRPISQISDTLGVHTITENGTVNSGDEVVAESPVDTEQTTKDTQTSAIEIGQDETAMVSRIREELLIDAIVIAEEVQASLDDDEIEIVHSDDIEVVVELSPHTGLPVPEKWSSQVSYVPIDKSVVDIFEFYAAKQPGAPAIRWRNEQWSYDDLNEQANRIANLLRSRDFGIEKEEPVAFFMEQSAYPIIAALAIVKAGGSYVPLDPTFQQSHLEYVLQNTGAKILIHDDSTADRCAELTEFDGRFIDLDRDVDLILSQPSENPKNIFGTDGKSRFHIIYTSGSTGKPKGIEILHEGFIRLSLNTNWINITSSSKFASMANYAFDASSFEIWSSLLNGAEIVILPRSAALNPRSLKRFLKDNKITQLFLTTQLFHFVAREVPDAFGTLDQIIVGGEALSPEWSRVVLESGSPPKRLTNGYGPAENSAASTFHDVKLEDIKEGYSVPIGIPLTNSEILVLNEKMEPVKIGDVGEICLSGPGLARGYMNRPDITSEKFIDHPFKKGERLYRSGDLARWAENGLLYYQGEYSVYRSRNYRIAVIVYR